AAAPVLLLLLLPQGFGCLGGCSGGAAHAPAGAAWAAEGNWRHISPQSSSGPGASTATPHAPEMRNGGGLPPDVPELHIGLLTTYPPFSYMVEGVPAGFARDLAESVAQAAGRRAVFHADDSGPVLRSYLAEGKVDMLALVAETPDRQTQMEFSEPGVEVAERIYVRRDGGAHPRGVAALSGLLVAVVESHASHQYLRNMPGQRVLPVPTPLDAVMAVAWGRADALVAPEPVVEHIIRRLPTDAPLEPSGQPLRTLRFSFGTAKGNTPLVAVLNEALVKVRASGEYDKLYRRWLGGNVLSRYTDRELLLGGAALVLLTVFLGASVMLLWRTVHLRRDVEAGTVATREARASMLREAISRQRAEQEAERFFALSLDPVAIVTQQGALRRVNPAWVRLFGFVPEEVTGHPFLDFVHPDDMEASRPLLVGGMNALAGAAATPVENRFRRRDGVYRWLAWASVVLPEEGVVYLSGRDVTQRKEAELHLERQAEELRRSNAELEQFAYIASHDLQEPLRKIASFLDLLAKRYVGRLDSDADEFIGFAVDAARRMKDMIEDLLAYSRVSTQGREFEDTDMEKVVNTVLSDLGLLLEEAGATVERGPLPMIRADRVQMEQLLRNLLGNAVKYRSETPPNISIGAERAVGDGQPGGAWVFHVRDNGIGMKPEHFERIFRVFQRLHGPGRYPGTGIGLAVCKKIVERHGGTIEVESAPGRGSTFRFVIPDRLARPTGSYGPGMPVVPDGHVGQPLSQARQLSTGFASRTRLHGRET
ncbi:ATP-binding protein, partial [Nitratidesulfovibrio oxamicus]|uniref:ATP-binding protein n=1 Tax=Nitratidesulfovibrio oxamicus TaxID=32016 RepID=UPI001E363B38